MYEPRVIGTLPDSSDLREGFGVVGGGTSSLVSLDERGWRTARNVLSSTGRCDGFWVTGTCPEFLSPPTKGPLQAMICIVIAVDRNTPETIKGLPT